MRPWLFVREHDVTLLLKRLEQISGIDRPLKFVPRTTTLEMVQPWRYCSPLHPTRHLGCGPAREGHQQNAARVGAIDDKMRDAMGERIGFARTRSGNNKKRHGRRATVFANAVFDRPPLFSTRTKARPAQRTRLCRPLSRRADPTL